MTQFHAASVAPFKPASVSGDLVAALALTVMLGLVGQLLRPLLSFDEPRYMAVAWEMWRTGDWLVPHLNGVVYPDKPPLLFWTINAAWVLFGVSEAAARILPMLFACVSVLLTAILARQFWPGRRDTAGAAALILAGTGLFAALSTLVMFDALLTVCVLIGMLGLDAARRGSAARGWLLFGIGVGLGVLAKGPVVLVHLLPPALLAPLWLRASPRPRWKRWYLGCVAGIGLGALVGLAWAIPAAVSGGVEYRNAIFWGQSASRIAGSSDHSHAQPIWFYVTMLPALLFPWLYWPPLWSAARRLRGLADDPLRLLAAWAVGAFLILTAFGGKQSHYLMPELPALALAAAFALTASHGESRTGRMPTVACLFAAAGAGALALWTSTGHHLPPALALLPPWTGAAFLGLAILFALARRASAGVLVTAALCPAMLAVGQLAAGAPLQAYDVADVAKAAKVFEPAGIAFAGDYHGELAFHGRLTQPVASLHDPDEMRIWMQSHPGGVLVGVPQALTEAPGLTEIFRKPYRNNTIAIWRVPG